MKRVREKLHLMRICLLRLWGTPSSGGASFCGRLDTKSGAHVRALMELAAWMEEKGWREDSRNAYRKMPEEGFPGTEDD